MRSLIKMEMTRYPVFSYRQHKQSIDPFQTQHKSPIMQNNALSNPKHKTKKNSIQNIYKKKKKNLQQSSYGISVPGVPRLSQKSINKYVSKITKSLQQPGSLEPIENKLAILKKIMAHLDVKNLNKEQYLRLIKTFGLKIESLPSNIIHKGIKTARAKIKKRINCSQMSNRKFQFSENLQRDLVTAQSNKLNRVNFYSIKLSKDPSFKTQRPLRYNNSEEKGCIEYKINKYREFLYVLNQANNIYRQLNIQSYDQPFKYYIGPGNNRNLIKSIMEKRFWFKQTQQLQNANFIWSQIKVVNIFNKQKQQIQKQRVKLVKIINQNKLQHLNSTTNQNNDPLTKILTVQQINIYKNSLENIHFSNILLKKKNQNKIKIKIEQFQKQILHNHFPNNGLLGNKKAMFYMMREYYKLNQKNIFDLVPLTFHINQGLSDQYYKQFLNYYNDRKKKKLPNYWIIKPGQYSNRGQGISCTSKLQQIKKRLSICKQSGYKKSIILQLYITNPLLYNFRKFDIRAYFMITCVNSKYRGYWYQDGYVRTSSYNWSLQDMADKQIHLTNDAIQKYSEAYGRYEPGNKLTYNDLQRYFDSIGKNIDLKLLIVPQMKRIASEAIKATYLYLDQKRKQSNFEIYGLDFMIDDNFKPWLIQINTNPCLEISTGVLQRIIPHMLQNAFSLDTLFPPPTIHPNIFKYNIPENALHYNKFELIFDEDRDGELVSSLYEKNNIINEIGDKQQDKDQYEEEGTILEFQQENR